MATITIATDITLTATVDTIDRYNALNARLARLEESAAYHASVGNWSDYDYCMEEYHATLETLNR